MGRGVAAALMRMAEALAVRRGRTLLAINEPAPVGDEALVHVIDPKRVREVDAGAVPAEAFHRDDHVFAADCCAHDHFHLTVDPVLDR